MTVRIAFEGIDSSGKTVQAARLAAALRREGYKVQTFSFPYYKGFFGREIRALLDGAGAVTAQTVDPKSMALWYALDRMVTLKRAASLTYESADFILFNRYTLSNVAYQAARAADLPGYEPPLDVARWIHTLEHNALQIPRPNVTFVLNQDPQYAFPRPPGDDRGALDVYERDLTYQSRVASFYVQLAQLLSVGTYIINATIDNQPRSIDVIAAQVWDALCAEGLV